MSIEMRVVYAEQHRLHDPQRDVQAGIAVDHVERPDRADAILATLRDHGPFRVDGPVPHGRKPIEAVHAPGLISFLERGTQPGPEFPDTIFHPGLREGMDTLSPEPTDRLGALGYWCFDTGTPINSGTHTAARAAVDVVLSATDLVLAGEPAASALCRPPGHHAARALFGGFCYFNNVAVAAEYAVERTGANVAVLDLDYHHGNGTQQIFYRRDDVLFVSLHADPLRAYPYFTGHADETGSGLGLGATHNIPLPAGTDDATYISALERALDVVTRWKPDITFLSFGADTYGEDPLGDFALTTEVYGKCGRTIAQAASRFVVVQEGGYYLPALGENVREFLLGLQSG